MGALHRLNRTERIPGQVKNLDEWAASNYAFHFALIERCDMPLLLKFHRFLTSMNDHYRPIFLKAVAIQKDVMDEHSAIAHAAVERRVDDAAALLTSHIERSTDNLCRLIADDLPVEPR